MSDTTEPLDLDALKALSDAATPGPWSADETGTVCADVDLEPDGAGGEILPEGGPMEVAECYRNERTGERAANAAFIAVTRSLLPEVLAELVQARAELERLTTGLTLVGWMTPEGFIAWKPTEALPLPEFSRRVFAERAPGGSVPDGEVR